MVIEFGEVNDTPIPADMLGEFLFAPPFELENEIDLEGNWDRRPPVNETERERVKRRLKF